jgi:hypothetical protein
MKRTFALLVAAAAAAVAVPAAQSHASNEIPPPVVISSTGACPGGYREVARAGNTVVCVTNVRPPSVRVTTTGCGTGETGYLVDGRYGVCTS